MQRRVQRAQPLERHRRPRAACRPCRRNLRLRLDERLFRLERVERAWSASIRSRTIASGSPSLTTSRSMSVLAHNSRTVGCSAILWYIAGCVNDGSSPSLCPPTVADEIDQDIATEPGRGTERQPCRFDARLRVVRVHVHDRDLESARQAARA